MSTRHQRGHLFMGRSDVDERFAIALSSFQRPVEAPDPVAQVAVMAIAFMEGEERPRRPHELTSYEWSVAVLLVAMCLEALSLRTAVREARRRRGAGESWLSFVHRTTVPELAVILLEDFGALARLSFALAGTTVAEVTGIPASTP